MLDYIVFLHTPGTFIKMADFSLLYLKGYVTTNCSTIRTGVTIHDQPDCFVFVFSATYLLITQVTFRQHLIMPERSQNTTNDFVFLVLDGLDVSSLIAGYTRHFTGRSCIVRLCNLGFAFSTNHYLYKDGVLVNIAHTHPPHQN